VNGEPNMDQSIRTQNVARYRRLLERVTEESDRQTFLIYLPRSNKSKKTRAIQVNPHGMSCCVCPQISRM
jgi:hypothetical protein